MSMFICEPLSGRHNRDGFDCGVVALNQYLRRQAGQDIRRHAAAVFVMVPEDRRELVVGYYALCASSVRLRDVPTPHRNRLARYPDVPAILIGRLARDTRFPGLGRLLLLDALARSLNHAGEIAATLVVVDAQNIRAQHFYQRFGFVSVVGNATRWFLPMKSVQQLFSVEDH